MHIYNIILLYKVKLIQMYTEIGDLSKDIEGQQKVHQIDGAAVTTIQSYSSYRLDNISFAQSYGYLTLIEFIAVITLQITLHYGVIVAWILILILLSFALLVHFAHWMSMLCNNISILCNMFDSIVLDVPIKKIIFVSSLYILHIVSHHAFIVMYCIGIIDVVPYKLILFLCLVIMHCFLSLAAVYCERKFYEQFVQIVLGQLG